MAKKLYKSEENKILFGVCGGFAEYFNIDATILRIIMILLCLLKGAGIILYLVCALVMPVRNRFESDVDIDNLKTANTSSKRTSKKAKKTSKKKEVHSDEDFDSFFKKVSK